MPLALLVGAVLAFAYRGTRGLGAVVLVVVSVALALGAVNRASDHWGYLLPWHNPSLLHEFGRDYIDPGACKTRGEAGAIEKAGWVRGYLTPSRRFYVPSKRPAGLVPVVIWMQGDTNRCFIAYALSGGP